MGLAFATHSALRSPWIAWLQSWAKSNNRNVWAPVKRRASHGSSHLEKSHTCISDCTLSKEGTEKESGMNGELRACVFQHVSENLNEVSLKNKIWLSFCHWASSSIAFNALLLYSLFCLTYFVLHLWNAASSSWWDTGRRLVDCLLLEGNFEWFKITVWTTWEIKPDGKLLKILILTGKKGWKLCVCAYVFT